MTLLFSYIAFYSYLLTKRSCDDDDVSMHSPNCDALSNEEQNMSNLIRSFDDIQCEMKKSYSHFNLRALWGIFMFSFFLHLRFSNGILIYWNFFDDEFIFIHIQSSLTHARTTFTPVSSFQIMLYIFSLAYCYLYIYGCIFVKGGWWSISSKTVTDVFSTFELLKWKHPSKLIWNNIQFSMNWFPFLWHTKFSGFL